MLIRRAVLDRIKAGEIDLQFRRWKRRTVKPGGTLLTKVGVLRIGAITPIRAEDVGEEDARRAGFAGVAAFGDWLATLKPGALERIEIGFEGADPRESLPEDDDLDAVEMAAVAAALERFDRRIGAGWSRKVLGLIAARPGERAVALAEAVGMDKRPFKARVRRLKELGLTQSLETGYRLSPRGARVLEGLARG